MGDKDRLNGYRNHILCMWYAIEMDRNDETKFQWKNAWGEKRREEIVSLFRA